MYKFVKTDAHPQLARLTEHYERLASCNERAVEAVRDQASAASKLRDLTEPKPRPGRESDIAARTAEHTSAMLEECAAFRALYEAASAMQTLIEPQQYQAAYNEILGAEEAQYWWLDTYSHNVMCCAELLKDAIETLGRFEETNQLHGTAEKYSSNNTMLPDAHFKQQGEFLNSWLLWATSLPKLDALASPEGNQLSDEFLLLSVLSRSAYTERKLSIPLYSWVCTERVRDRLQRVGWQVKHTGGGEPGSDSLDVRRPKSTVAPLMPAERSGPGPRRSFK